MEAEDQALIDTLSEVDKTLKELEVQKNKVNEGKATFTLEFPKSTPIKIANLNEVPLVKEVRVSNLSDIPEPKEPEFPSEMRISNLGEIPRPSFPENIGIKKPAWLPLVFAPLKPIKQTLDEISTKLDQKRESFPTKDSEAIPVRVINHPPQQAVFGGGGTSIPKTVIGDETFVPTVSGLSLPDFDYVSNVLSGGDTIETYTFKKGGSSGNRVATVVIVYTDNTRNIISTVTKT